ncbi:hypothetical protein ACWDKQ_34435 [Saccharopolyspora sp. NPDC000995]
MTPEERDALDQLVPADQRSDDLVHDLTAAARTAMQRRIDNSRWGGAVLAALHRELGSWRQLEALTGIPQATARRWATPPPGTETPRPGNTNADV